MHSYILYPRFQKLEMIAYCPASCFFLPGASVNSFHIILQSFFMLFNRCLYLHMYVATHRCMAWLIPTQVQLSHFLSFTVTKAALNILVCTYVILHICKYVRVPVSPHSPHSMFPNFDFLQCDRV